jgi:hypothetical protein
LEALFLTSSSSLLSFGLFFVTMLLNSTSFISCCYFCAFFSFSLSYLKTCSSTMRFLIASRTLIGELPSLFFLYSSGVLCSWFSSSPISTSFCASMIHNRNTFFLFVTVIGLLVFL